MKDVAARLTTRVQITTDGHKAYIEAVEDAFGMDVDYALLIKLYGSPAQPDTRYSPGVCIGTESCVVMGKPGPQARFHVVCGAPEPHDADVDAAVYPTHKRLLKEAGEP
jgi:hypothetical protein